ncbi:MAG: response regulator [Desulfuromonadales bacterium]|nr:response regulator [Desulfuromonadales bacterium]
MTETPCILLVDDDLINLGLLEKILAPHYRTVSTTDGFEAIRLVKEHRPDLILLDMLLPQLNGLEICGLLREDKRLKTIPVLFLTGHDRAGADILAQDLGVVDLLQKPYALDSLRLRVRNYITLKRSLDQIEALQAELAGNTEGEGRRAD